MEKSAALLNAQVELLVQAMVSFGASQGACTVIPQDVTDQLETVLTDTWQLVLCGSEVFGSKIIYGCLQVKLPHPIYEPTTD